MIRLLIYPVGLRCYLTNAFPLISGYASQSLSLGGVEEIHDVGAQGNGTHFWRRWKTLCALNSNIENGFAEHTTNISNRMPQSHQHIRSIHFVCKICGSDNLFKKLETGKKPVGIHLNIGKRDMASESTLSAEEIVEVLKNAKDSTELEPLIASIEKVPLDVSVGYHCLCLIRNTLNLK